MEKFEMKKLKLLGALVIVLFLIIGVMNLWAGPSIYGPTAIPFPYDPNNVIVSPVTLQPKLLGGIDVRAGVEVIVDIDVNDPDDDPFSVRVLNWQSGMNLTVGDANTPSQLKWTPMTSQEGLHYINIESWDFPPDPNDSLTDRGTLVFLVRPRNRPPILLPLDWKLVE